MKTSDLKELLLDTFGHLSDKQLMALTIYGEARGEAKEGKVAVGSVILERVEHRRWDGETIPEVCLMP
jgi:spore germination cell wall hydrolase CwlJ-like protein